MIVIQPNCRVQFTAADIDFIISTLGTKVGARDVLVDLLASEETRDLILDNEKLLHALLERQGCLGVSTHFYFYVVVRQVLLRSGITNRPVADYVAEMLAEFSRTERSRFRAAGQGEAFNYFFEMLAALETADERTRFLIRAHIGNHSLFLTGLFPERIRVQAESRGFPNMKYYEQLGRTNFRVASDHRLARRYDLDAIFATLSEQFQATRLALNDITERLFSFGDPEIPGGPFSKPFGSPLN